VHGRPVGFEIDLARYLARVLFDDERRARLVPVTTATRFAELQAGRVDLLIATVTATDERRRLAELSEPYFVSASLVREIASSDAYQRASASTVAEPQWYERGRFRAFPVAFVMIGAVAPAPDHFLGPYRRRNVGRRRRSLDGRRIRRAGRKNKKKTRQARIQTNVAPPTTHETPLQNHPSSESRHCPARCQPFLAKHLACMVAGFRRAG